MEEGFEDLIASYIENKVGISEHFLSKELADNLKQKSTRFKPEELAL